MVLLFLKSTEAIARRGCAISSSTSPPHTYIYSQTYFRSARHAAHLAVLLRQVLYIVLVSCSEYALFFLLFLMTSSEGRRGRAANPLRCLKFE